MTVETDSSDIRLSAADWAEAFEAPDPGTPHNDARDQVWESVLSILQDKHDGDEPADLLRKSLQQNRELLVTFNRAWPLLEATDLGDLWSVPAYLRSAPPGSAPTTSGRCSARTPRLDRLRPADAGRGPQSARRPGGVPAQRRQEAIVAAERERMALVIDELIATDDSELLLMTTLRHGDLGRPWSTRQRCCRQTRPARRPFAHVVVDEAQELTDAEWQMLLLRCPSRSFTIVGDRAQARHVRGVVAGTARRIGLHEVNQASLTINYRTPEEVMAEAEPVIRAVLPDANVPISIRSGASPSRTDRRRSWTTVLDSWLDEHAEGEGIACVIGDPTFRDPPASGR